MAIVIPNGYINASTVWRDNSNGYKSVTAFGVATDPPFGVEDLVDAADTIAANMNLGIWNALYLSDQVTLEKLVVTTGTNLGPVSYEKTLNIVGTDEVQPLPPNVAWIARKYTLMGGRENRGRMFFPAAVLCAQARVSGDGVIQETYVDLMQEKLDDFRDAMTADSFDLVLFHSDGSTPTPITNLVAEGTVATQRRRLKR